MNTDNLNESALNNPNHSRGYVLIGVVMLLALASLLSIGMLESAGTNSKTRALVTTQADYYYEVEGTLNRVVTWLQDNSENLSAAFNSDFETYFDTGSPSLGGNEGEHFGVPTMVKMAGTNNSVMLSNNAFFGTPAFPALGGFNAITEFANADLGTANARIVLVWARESSGNFEPIFRIDVVTGNNPDRGVHSYSFVYSTLLTTAGGPGFYGQTSLELATPNNDCYSYAYTYAAGPGTWSKGAPRSNCSVNSDGVLDVSSKVYGVANTLLDDGVVLSPPGGDVSGGTCDGPGCHSLTLENPGTWDILCPGVVNDLNYNSNGTLASGGCYRDITISNNRTVLFTDTTQPYYFRRINYGGNNARITFPTLPPGPDKIRIYSGQYSANGNNHINGNKYVNSNNPPHKVEFWYLGTDQLQLNGNVEMNGVIYAPYATVQVNGNFNFYGAIKAKLLDVRGNARINYDEELGASPVLTDLNFSLKKTSQRYR